MEKISLPKKIEFKDGEQLHEGMVIVEPLYPGYGMTLGNSLRRVLLSSLPGAAVVGVKIKGASHEFMATPNIKEDVLEIVLNLKQLRFKMHSEEEIKLELSVSGKKSVKASDITKNSQVEIINPDLVLATITDPAGNLNMDIYIRPGRGYQLSEGDKKASNEIGYIEVDAIFSPILAVSSNVENVRVGKMTNWDKLIVNIKTDGTITYEEAFKESTQILIDQFNSLLASPEIIPAKETEVVEAVEVKEIKEEVKEKKTKKVKK
ncbi:DNA-directed RNA polymerase subunit alpha [Candidatus Falkowbacteria bacterium CG10_big_fil_rev_8_21_14_0_10_39_9]|uniref:DNA-directed RNA polymerase subunit alpha n=1 Tax=Candidatus Falkowbacteria bacterium CG10_big_fil_rev_8_21_14_0_10_39_9 TaxID=1974566 RepID=A0A2M6WNR0_9BACT|nr:MAG: DNA-directed RNA polymerase subunit alpha [Candidatus Falkowbacteria bacterium CG10_big_fil_rev_8_21_14_0_10_39_9]